MKTTATRDDLDKALALVNLKYAGNVRLNEVAQRGKYVQFTLRPLNSKGLGGATSRSYFQRGRAVHACCWHVHGHFFDLLFQINPAAIIISRGKKITHEAGNWEDTNIGPPISPLMHSEACRCEEIRRADRAIHSLRMKLKGE